MTVATYGLAHVALGVKDPARAFRFYRDVFGMVAVYDKPDFVQAQTPGRASSCRASPISSRVISTAIRSRSGTSFQQRSIHQRVL